MNITQPSKKNGILPFAMSCIELEYIMLSKIGQRQIPHDFTHIWNLRNQTDEHRGRKRKKRETEANHKRLLTIENKLRVVVGEVRQGDGPNG